MKKVTIPTCANPFVVIVNGMKYTYPAGETVEVPDDVAEVIEQHEETHNNPKPDPVPPPYSGGVKSWNDLEDRPFGEVGEVIGNTFDWDGETYDESVALYTDDNGVAMVCHVLDCVPTMEDLTDATFSFNFFGSDMTLREGELIQHGEVISLHFDNFDVPMVVVVRKAGATAYLYEQTVSFNKTGIWLARFANFTGANTWLQTINTPNYIFTKSTRISKMYLPEKPYIDLSSKIDIAQSVQKGGGIVNVSYDKIEELREKAQQGPMRIVVAFANQMRIAMDVDMQQVTLENGDVLYQFTTFADYDGSLLVIFVQFGRQITFSCKKVTTTAFVP